jgi:hypothetical protein
MKKLTALVIVLQPQALIMPYVLIGPRIRLGSFNVGDTERCYRLAAKVKSDL